MDMKVIRQFQAAHLMRSRANGTIHEEEDEDEDEDTIAEPPPPSAMRRRMNRRQSLFDVASRVDPDLDGTFTITQQADPFEYNKTLEDEVSLLEAAMQEKLAKEIERSRERRSESPLGTNPAKSLDKKLVSRRSSFTRRTSVVANAWKKSPTEKDQLKPQETNEKAPMTVPQPKKVTVRITKTRRPLTPELRSPAMKRVSFPSDPQSSATTKQRPKTAFSYDQWKRQIDRSDNTDTTSSLPQRPSSATAASKDKNKKTYMPTNFLQIPLRRPTDPIPYQVPQRTKSKQVKPKTAKKKAKNSTLSKSADGILEFGRVKDRSVKIRLSATRVGPKITATKSPVHQTIETKSSNSTFYEETKAAFAEQFGSREDVYPIETVESANREQDLISIRPLQPQRPNTNIQPEVKKEPEEDSYAKQNKTKNKTGSESAEEQVIRGVLMKANNQMRGIPKLSLRMQDCLSLADLMRYTRMRMEMQMVTS